MQYPTKKDTWLVAVLAGAVALPIVLGIVFYVQTGTVLAALIPLGVTALMVISICLVAVPTRYDVTADQLVIRSGLLRWRVPLTDIVSIVPSSNPVASPAWSLDRLEVTSSTAGHARSILISPRRTDDFLREVAAQDSTLVLANGGLRRAH